MQKLLTFITTVFRVFMTSYSWVALTIGSEFRILMLQFIASQWSHEVINTFHVIILITAARLQPKVHYSKQHKQSIELT